MCAGTACNHTCSVSLGQSFGHCVQTGGHRKQLSLRMSLISQRHARRQQATASSGAAACRSRIRSRHVPFSCARSNANGEIRLSRPQASCKPLAACVMSSTDEAYAGPHRYRHGVLRSGSRSTDLGNAGPLWHRHSVCRSGSLSTDIAAYAGPDRRATSPAYVRSYPPIWSYALPTRCPFLT